MTGFFAFMDLFWTSIDLSFKITLTANILRVLFFPSSR